MSRRRKVHPSQFRPSEGIARSVKVDAWVQRSGGRNSMAFTGCVRLGHTKNALRSRIRSNAAGYECGVGSSPRRALAHAMTRLAKTLRRRSSAFRGAR